MIMKVYPPAMLFPGEPMPFKLFGSTKSSITVRTADAEIKFRLKLFSLMHSRAFLAGKVNRT
jgi:hypothetical protein